MKTIYLAVVLADSSISDFGRMDSGMKEYAILTGALLVVIASLLAWAYMSRRNRRQSARREDRRHRRRSITQDAAKGVVELTKYVKERQGGRRREHRPRNPTLAETGGLPPIRSDDPSPPTSPP